MSKADYAALIALCAALASTVGDVIRQRSAQEGHQQGGRPPRTLHVVGTRPPLVAVATIALAPGEAATMAAGAGQDAVPRDEAMSNRQLRRAAHGFS